MYTGHSLCARPIVLYMNNHVWLSTCGSGTSGGPLCTWVIVCVCTTNSILHEQPCLVLKVIGSLVQPGPA